MIIQINTNSILCLEIIIDLNRPLRMSKKRVGVKRVYGTICENMGSLSSFHQRECWCHFYDKIRKLDIKKLI